MNKITNAVLVLLVVILSLMTIILLRIKNRQDSQQEAVLAQELQRISKPLSLDLGVAHLNSIQGVPADGLWHNRIFFIQPQLGGMEYVIKAGRLLRINEGRILMVAENIDELHFRRQGATPDIIEVRIEARKNVSLMSYLKIRVFQ